MLFQPVPLHPLPLRLELLIEEVRNAVVYRLEFLGGTGADLDGVALSAHDGEVAPARLVGVLARAVVVEDPRAAYVELLDLHGKRAVSSLRFLDGDVVLGLR